MLGIPYLESAIFRLFKPTNNDDSVDRLNYCYTSVLLSFFAIMVSAKQYVGSPIQCWMPMEFKGGWEQYAEDYCFIQNTYFIPFHNEIPTDTDQRTEGEIGYYQWVPIVLALQAMMFFLPNFLWKTLHKQSGIDLQSTVDSAMDMKSMTTEQREEKTYLLTNYMSEILQVKDKRRAPYRMWILNRDSGRGIYVSYLYVFCKFLNLANIISQFFILNAFLGSDYTLWGLQTFQDLMSGREWLESGVFPRVTLCDFKVRKLANIHRYTVQCVLMINMFNEKIFLFIWFWFLFVAIVTFINVVYSFATILPSHFRQKTIKRLIQVQPGSFDDSFVDNKAVALFTEQALKPDGVLLMHFIERHAGTMIAKEIAHKMWLDFLIAENNRLGNSTKTTTSPLEGPREQLYPTEKRSLMSPEFVKEPMV